MTLTATAVVGAALVAGPASAADAFLANGGGNLSRATSSPTRA